MLCVPVKSVIRRGLAAAWPICLGHLSIAMALRVLGPKAGLHPLAIGVMSLIDFAGSAQFIAVSMLSSGMLALTIVLTTFVVNLRHLLMSFALGRSLSRPAVWSVDVACLWRDR